MKIFKSCFIGLLLIFVVIATVHAQSINELFHENNDPVAGNPNGSVTIVEFFDYQCSYCKKMAPIIDRIIKANPNVRIVFKELSMLGPDSNYAATAALAANKQGKYYPFSYALFNSWQRISPQTIARIAQKTGVNITQLKRDMNGSSIAKQLDDNQRLASALHLTGTPTFFIGPTNASSIDEIKLIPSEISQSALQNEIDKWTR